MPGVRVNIGTRGTSLSLGGRGATYNISSRGTRTTVGIPGTGLSWSESSSSSSNNRQSVQRQNAEYRRQQNEAVRINAENEVARLESEKRDIVEHWREMPIIPSNQDFHQAMLPQDFVFDAKSPDAPNEQMERKKLLEKSVLEARKAVHLPNKNTLIVVAIIIALLTIYSTYNVIFGILCVAGWAFLNTKANKISTDLFNQKWGLVQQELLTNYNNDVNAYEQQKSLAKTQWQSDEKNRVDFFKKLVNGDQDTVNMAVSDAIEQMDFPFEAACSVSLESIEKAFISVDLPEIEDVIPEVKRKVLKNGQIKESNRTKKEKNDDYLILVAGLAVLIARTAFSATPTLQCVVIGAYTQRRNAKTGQIIDAWVYDVPFRKADVSAFSPLEGDPVQLIGAVPNARFLITSTQELKQISSPEWY